MIANPRKHDDVLSKRKIEELDVKTSLQPSKPK